jgi:hypothetical protein
MKGKKLLENLRAFPMITEFALSQARVIVAYAPLSADAVLAGTKKFSEAFVQAQRMKTEQTADDEKKAKLADRPDLVEWLYKTHPARARAIEQSVAE